MAFFNFFVNIFKSYQDCLIPIGKKEQGRPSDGIMSYFDFEKFRTTTDNDQKPFFKYFLTMQMFTRFLERKLWAQKIEDVIDVYLFDEYVKLKLKRIKRTLFQSVS